MKNSLRGLIRAAKARKKRKIHSFTRALVDLARLVHGPCHLEGMDCKSVHKDAHFNYLRLSIEESRQAVARATFYIGIVLFVCFLFLGMSLHDPAEGVPPDLMIVFRWMGRFSPVFFLVWLVILYGWFHGDASVWVDHEGQLSAQRERIEGITLGTFVADELRARIASAGKRLFEGGAGLLGWQKRVTDRLSALPATEAVTMPLSGGGHPYHATPGVTGVQSAADQAELLDVASAYRALATRITEAFSEWNALARVLGESVDHRDALERTRGTDFDPTKDVATIDRDIETALDALFTEIASLEAEVLALNARADAALSARVVKSVRQSLAKVRIGGEDPHADVETAALGSPPPEGRQKKNGS